ncbi:MAG TPA: sigma-70 family RNA polymerase sigma factor [Steroidobacteraceae bacterium]|jgi:RNA polymerase sigma factor (TIGR02999 family)
MNPEPRENITRLLLDWSGGNEAALTNLFPMVYDELRSIAQSHLRRERSKHTLQRTALVHEAFLRLVDQKSVTWQSRAHFFGLASQMMRRILVDHARKRGAAKRGSDPVQVDLDDLPEEVNSDLDFEEFDRLLKEFERIEPRAGRLVELRFFGGLNIEDASAVLEISVTTAKRDWAIARAWLQRELSRD